MIQVLDKIFNMFASRWMSMKIQSKNEEEAHSQKFKFKPRALKLESIIDLNISSLGKLFANESFLEWKEFLSKDMPIERVMLLCFFPLPLGSNFQSLCICSLFAFWL